MIRVIFLGPPGSGKGTQAHLISNKYNIANISTGEILRKLSLYNQSNGIDFDNTFVNTMNAGHLIDDELIIKLIIQRIQQADCSNGFILDGFPRTINQALSIKQKNISIDFVMEFNVSDIVVIDRIIGRQIHINSGRTYHVKYNPPKHYGIDDMTGEKLIFRTDDNVEAVQQRLDQYYKYTKPLSKFYEKELELGNLLYFSVNANRKVSQIYKELINIFKLHKF